MRISVIVPTWQRPDSLFRCLAGLREQERPPDEVVVVLRDVDDGTVAALGDRGLQQRERVEVVSAPGHVAALNQGLEAATGDVLAITDDDAVPRPDWVLRIERHFEADPRVGGVGGRDWVHGPSGTDDRQRDRVGRLHWFGRLIGNHHLGTGPVREVEVLKGANMSFRRDAAAHAAFDSRFRGRQLFNDASFSLRVGRAGWKLIYDPLVAVDHYPAPTATDPRSGQLAPDALADAVHNETVALLEHLPQLRRAAFLAWAVLVGTRSAPGIAQTARLALSGRPQPLALLRASLAGRRDGWRTWRATGGPAGD